MIDFAAIYMSGLTPKITSAKIALSYTILLPMRLKYSSSVQVFFFFFMAHKVQSTFLQKSHELGI